MTLKKDRSGPKQASLSNPGDFAARVKGLVQQALEGRLEGYSIAALGLANQPMGQALDSSPAVAAALQLLQAGAVVTAYDPDHAEANVDGLRTVPTLAQAIDDADVLLLLVDHPILRSIDPVVAAQLTRARWVVDAVSGWDEASWTYLGFRFYRLEGIGK